jgi:hypothetical protein
MEITKPSVATKDLEYPYENLNISGNKIIQANDF